MIAFFLLLFMLDIQHPPKADNPFAGFVVTSAADNSAMSGCTMNPGSGNNFNADMISVDWAGVNDPHEGEAAVSRLVTSSPHDNETFITPMVMPYDPPGQPNPNPDPPAAAVPEPPTAAILTISAVVLFLLLFGRARGKRLVRR